MDNDRVWIGAEEFAELARISPQAARQALRRAASGGIWRGHALTVRMRAGRGGRAGLSYETCLRDLPVDLRPEGPVSMSTEISCVIPRPATGQSMAIKDRLETIRAAMAQPVRSAERAAAVATAAARTRRSERTLYRWIERYENAGIGGLARRRSSGANEPRVTVSRVFDRAFRSAGHENRLLDAIALDIRKALKGLWASPAEQAGVNEIRRLAEFLLLEACEARGLTLPKSAMRLSRRAVERFAHYRVVNQRRNDRKAFDDAKPRIRRDWTMLAPMERVVADVKHLDVVVTRDDGSPAWPKIVAFMDAGTGRVFVHPVLLERGEAVRQEHVIEAFLAMVSDPSWGFPQGLYLDNGMEFGALAKIDSALQQLNDPGVRTLIYARPYNAAAKPIESLFARLDRYVFSMLPGYAGPNRMAKKTQTVGRPPKPYPGSWVSFRETVSGLIAAHNQRPVGGQWADRSPDDWFAEKIARGWKTVQVDQLALDCAFCDRDSRRLDRGVLRIGGTRFSHPEIQALPTRTVVDLALPWRRDAAPLCRIPGGGWVYLQREVPFPARWIEGARESSRRQKRQSRYVAELARDAPQLDPVAIKLRAARQHEPIPPPPSSRIDIGDDQQDLAVARRKLAPESDAANTAADARRAREQALTERLERRFEREP